jgi:hypothetical protein
MCNVNLKLTTAVIENNYGSDMTHATSHCKSHELRLHGDSAIRFNMPRAAPVL